MLERQKRALPEILAEIRKLTSGVALSDAFAAYGNLFRPSTRPHCAPASAPATSRA
jgi:hypothetical protein